MTRRKTKVGNNDEDPKEKPVKGIQMDGDEIKTRLIEAGSEEELTAIKKTLKLEGVPQGSIDGNVARLKKKGELIFVTALTERGEGTKPLVVEAIIQEMKLPVIVNGGAKIFDAGVGYGMRALIAGVRLAQELSQMGIAQASPVIRMATEMRKAEGMSAQEAGQRAAEDALAGAIQYLSEKKVDIATVPNPMMGIMARAMEPALTQVMGKMFGTLGGQPAQGAVQPQSGTDLPPGWSAGEEKPSEEQTEK